MESIWAMREKESKTNEKETPFSRWLNAAVERRGIDLAELGRRVSSDYNYMWRLSSGARKRPGYELTRAIGESLGDIDGALKAAGYKPATDEEPNRSTFHGIFETSDGRRYILTRRTGDPNAPYVLTDELIRVLEALEILEEITEHNAGGRG